MTKVLLVVMEVSFKEEVSEFRNSSLNTILQEYMKHFDRLVVFCPGASDAVYVVSDYLVVETVGCVGGRVSQKIKFHFSSKYDSRFESLISKYNVTTVQFRIPSLFTLRFTRCNLGGAAPIFYIAGDWVASLSLNYPYPFVKTVARHLERKQNAAIKGLKVVTAGPVLSEKYKPYAGSVFPYYSTTHLSSQVYNRSDKDWDKLCCVGRLEPLKAFSDAIRAIKILKDQGVQNLILFICGDGKDRPKLEALIEEFSLESNVKMLGNIKKDELVGIYKSCSFIIHPSLSEGTPKVLPEAMSFGCIPVAVQGVGSIDFIISDGVNGLIVPPSSPAVIARKISSVLQNPVTQDILLDGVYNYSSEHTIENEVAKMWAFANE